MSDLDDDDEEDATFDDALGLIRELMLAYGIIYVQLGSHAHVQAEYERPDRLN